MVSGYAERAFPCFDVHLRVRPFSSLPPASSTSGSRPLSTPRPLLTPQGARADFAVILLSGSASAHHSAAALPATEDEAPGSARLGRKTQDPPVFGKHASAESVENLEKSFGACARVLCGGLAFGERPLASDGPYEYTVRAECISPLQLGQRLTFYILHFTQVIAREKCHLALLSRADFKAAIFTEADSRALMVPAEMFASLHRARSLRSGACCRSRSCAIETGNRCGVRWRVWIGCMCRVRLSDFWC